MIWLSSYNSIILVGETLPKEQQIYRVKVVTAFLRAGIPLNKVSAFRDILEESAFRLTDRRNLNDYIPFILKQEETCITKEIKNKYVSIIFDGTSRIGEALAIVVRFVNDEWKIQQRLVQFVCKCYQKVLQEKKVARELISVVSYKANIKEDQRQLLPVVKHLRTDGPQPIVLTSDADSQRLAVGGRPGADGSE